jgi:hypothetical protein
LPTKLPITIAKLADVANQFRECYVAKPDGSWTLDIDGVPDGWVPKARLDEFRNNNKALNLKVNELETRLKTFDGVDPTAAAATAAKLTELEARFEGVDPNEYRSLKAKPDLSARVSELETKLAASEASAARSALKTSVGDAFLRAGGLPEAADFITSKAETIFAMTNGQLTTEQWSAERPGEKLSLDEWMRARYVDAAFAFRPSGGGGASKGNRLPGPNTISGDDFGKNIDAIAAGKVTVV